MLAAPSILATFIFLTPMTFDMAILPVEQHGSRARERETHIWATSFHTVHTNFGSKH